MGLFNKKKKGTDVPETGTAAIAATGAGEAAETANEELLVVLTAAMAAYEAEQFAQTLYIQKINRAVRVLPAWGTMGTQEAIDTRRM